MQIRLMMQRRSGRRCGSGGSQGGLPEGESMAESAL
jgi:hypothetical protein